MKSNSIYSRVWLLLLNIVFERFTQDVACICNSFIFLAQFSSVQSISYVQLFVTPWLQHARLPCPSLSPGLCSNSCLLSWWYHPTISSSVVPFSSSLQSFVASGSFQMSQLFASGGQSIEISASVSVLHMNIQGWFLLGLTGLISLLSKWLLIVSSSTTIRKHQFFSAQPFLFYIQVIYSEAILALTM